MTLSDELHKLADRVKVAEQKVEQAQKAASEDAGRTKTDLEQTLKEAVASAETQARKLRDTAKEHEGKLSEWWDSQQARWSAHIAAMHRDVEHRKAEHDAKRAERRAEHSEVDAEFAVDYAYGAIIEAEYAVLDAILARAEAEDAHSMG